MLFFRNNKDHLSEEERQKILNKIEKKYSENSRRYGKKVFDILKFYERYNEALSSGFNEENFLFAEVQAITDFEEKKRKEEEERNRKPTTIMADMYNEFSARLDKYPRVSIHERAEKEIEVLLGTLKEFVSDFNPALKLINDSIFDSSVGRAFRDLEGRIAPLTEHRAEELPKEFAHYRDTVARLKDREEIQKCGHLLLKHSFELFNSVIEFLRAAGRSDRNVLDRIKIDHDFRSYSFDEFKDIMSRTIEQLLYDFRLRSLKSDAFL